MKKSLTFEHTNYESEGFIMKDAKGFAKGAMTGLVAGAVMMTAGKMLKKKNDHHLQKGSTKAVKAVGDFVSGIQTMMK